MKRSSLRPISLKMKREQNRYMKLKKEYLKAHPICEICKTFISKQIHHRKGRLGSLLCEVKYFLATCQLCHQYIHSNPAEARKRGWMIDRIGNSIFPHSNL